MMKTNKAIKTTLMLGLAAWTMSSCQDWLTVYPQTQIVEEDFWEDKNDLEGVRYAAYQQMCSTLSSLALWGDLRSDSYALNTADETKDGTIELYTEIREGRIERDSASTYFDWSGVYRTINYCNKVLQHGPEVLERDPQFTRAEWLQMRAEMTGLRALNYFYLIRAFKDVPYSTKVVNNDKEVLYFGATNQLVVLDSLIVDVEEVAGQARNRFSSQSDTKGLITNPALYAMLSDMYLWRAALHQGRGIERDTVIVRNVPSRLGEAIPHSVFGKRIVNGDSIVEIGDYESAVYYADLAMESLVKQNNRNGVGFGSSREETLSYGLSNCNLIKNNFDNFSNGNFPRLTAYNSIYLSKNSEESIFELQFSQSDGRKNEFVNSIWGNGAYSHLVASNNSLTSVYGGSTVERSRDARMWFSAWDKVLSSSQALPGSYCFKWSSSLSFMMPTASYPECKDIRIMATAGSYCNWIIYRLSDVMLQKAEALVMLDQGVEAMKYVNALHRRWYCNDARGTDPISGMRPIEDVTSMTASNCWSAANQNQLGNIPTPGKSDAKSNYEIAVFNERQIEFLGEGKRWFDLVRYAERYAGDEGSDPREGEDVGSGRTGLAKMFEMISGREFSKEMINTLTNRLKNRYGLYNLIYYKEIQASNGLLQQNPVWNRSTFDN